MTIANTFRCSRQVMSMMTRDQLAAVQIGFTRVFPKSSRLVDVASRLGTLLPFIARISSSCDSIAMSAIVERYANNQLRLQIHLATAFARVRRIWRSRPSNPRAAAWR